MPLSEISSDVRQYLLVTLNYWTFTITDGALRMLVVLYFHQLGYDTLSIALMFLFYEFFGIVTNLVGGWLGARLGLNVTMNIGLGLQIIALSMLLVPTEWFTIAWVMLAQALSGIAKDLNKMSAKSAIKILLPDGKAKTKLYQWVAILTGSKNTMKGIGFFVGAGLLNTIGFQNSAGLMATVLGFVLLISLIKLQKDFGKITKKTKFSQLLSQSSQINRLSAARFFLFGARDIWFVIAVPVFLSAQLNWPHWQVGTFMACWVIGYGIIQTVAPRLTGKTGSKNALLVWVVLLTLIMISLAYAFYSYETALTFNQQGMLLVGGLIVFGAVFAVNSSLHSFLIVHFSCQQSVSMNVGFYYMANAAGRLAGTVLSGWLFQSYGLNACLLMSSCFLILASLVSTSISFSTNNQ